jgi:hypothetical protein
LLEHLTFQHFLLAAWVERAIRYIRNAFFAGRTFADLTDLNAQADAWSAGPAAQRPCPEAPAISVAEAFVQEQPRLLSLPEQPYPTDEQVAVAAGKTPYVRFDLNDYSIPHTHVRRTLTVVASPQQVRILDGQQVLACHARSYDRGAQIEDPVHIETLVRHKRAARAQRATDRLAQAAPASGELLTRAGARGENLGTISAALMRLLDRYGASELQGAIEDALARGVPHPNAVRLALERRREARQLPPPVAMSLPEHVRARDILVPPQRLDTYDQLMMESDDDEQS